MLVRYGPILNEGALFFASQVPLPLSFFSTSFLCRPLFAARVVRVPSRCTARRGGRTTRSFGRSPNAQCSPNQHVRSEDLAYATSSSALVHSQCAEQMLCSARSSKADAFWAFVCTCTIHSCCYISITPASSHAAFSSAFRWCGSAVSSSRGQSSSAYVNACRVLQSAPTFCWGLRPVDWKPVSPLHLCVSGGWAAHRLNVET